MTNRLVDLPPLDLLRTFVAVGRRMSITLGAQDLCIVQSAVSRQIQALESVLECRLFVRAYRSLEFTPEGRNLFRSIDPMFEQLGSVIASLRPAATRPCITITASIGITSLWLLPKLGAFQRRAPDIDVRVAATNRVINLERDGMDLALRYSPDASAPEGAIRMFSELLIPVAHPSLGIEAIEEPEQWRRQVLIDYDDTSRPWMQWQSWLRGTGYKPSAAHGGRLLFNQYDQVVQAALAGQGVALGRLALVAPLLADGQLVVATRRPPAATDHGYWLIQRSGADNPALAEVRNWILAEAAATSALL
ncbi:LysR substrate-binding domain-containing protein [Massilia sp. TS11]|uniref:LysR substrate-binding domain-containing protein n=1 Tax=Massilia sp. TS11 TaxID=2908003 RepID=UPI001EDAE1BF|nr:LysR substrate-binding domain-containing protein [Massilia sp. TS11]MCG2584350.1 LysR substrate-binding domain-containing protein [Massilia sp. TS11]